MGYLAGNGLLILVKKNTKLFLVLIQIIMD